ncbi:MAG TPA: DUF4256 domain-containing protein [Bellilinea sp.]|nr:DUF4256 domain-containing protein [Bellilinea sp.]
MIQKLTDLQADELIQNLRNRFEKNKVRHPNLQWEEVESRLRNAPDKLWSLHQMESTGGEPDVVSFQAGEIAFADCAAESPAPRRSLCYDQAALDARKANKPAGSALETAKSMGIELLDEAQYQALQKLGKFDLKTSSWLHTPPEVRKLGGAIFGDRRFDRVFIYHNGADSYYGARGFRGLLYI